MTSTTTSFGLYVGNTTTSLGVYRGGRGCDVVANPSGDRVTPSTVCWHEGGDVGVGLSAKHHAQRFPKSAVVWGNKSVLGRATSDPSVQSVASVSGVSTAKVLIEGAEAKYQVEIEGANSKCVAPREVLYHILKYMHDIALTHVTSEDEVKTVLTVPWDYTPEQRETVKMCAEKAGFQVLQIISEPAAAAMAYNLGQLDAEETFTTLVYRSGGLSTSCTVLAVNAGFVSVIGHVTKDLVGGQRVTEVMSNFLADEFKRKYKMDPRENKRSLQKLKTHGENVKHVLSTLQTAGCNIESLHEGMDFNAQIARARFENCLSDLMPELLAPIQEVLTQCNMDRDSLQKLILCGGNARVPKIQKAVKDFLPNCQVLASINCDEVFSFGAAVQSSLVQERDYVTQTRCQLKALSANLLYKINDEDAVQVLIPKSCPIPVKKSALLDPGTNSTLVVEFFADMAKSRASLAKLTLAEVTEESRINLSAHFYRDGTLHISLTDKVKGVTEQLHIPPVSSS
ncbi:hypothetical protein TCAL_12267 [Tigriopus californicus]|uniref:Heat shock 70 kDa protein 14 n=1 Tax=Tigriopus californicus TaxID=6832 RepID=A0A553N8S6_TIGCA|nr:heat shock 70 kDa protein 14-B-like isoform X2 [Tigriopus californicus]TRY61769.1 hypothetical protein TCAL_12267 [Tigriopus californicus]|eukprot:TCALIF_12267-PA protein Name:"Similar to hspa14-b Heat shock 70 kDa protein 14-B (Xenopus laevis)" AED:0.05 eAED:0.05 QI:140/1/1/1/1/1/7/375/510